MVVVVAVDVEVVDVSAVVAVVAVMTWEFSRNSCTSAQRGSDWSPCRQAPA